MRAGFPLSGPVAFYFSSGGGRVARRPAMNPDGPQNFIAKFFCPTGASITISAAAF
jgi:hypothetical protein